MHDHDTVVFVIIKLCFMSGFFPVPLGLEGLADSGGDVGDRAAWCRGRAPGRVLQKLKAFCFLSSLFFVYNWI